MQVLRRCRYHDEDGSGLRVSPPLGLQRCRTTIIVVPLCQKGPHPEQREPVLRSASRLHSDGRAKQEHSRRLGRPLEMRD